MADNFMRIPKGAGGEATSHMHTFKCILRVVLHFFDLHLKQKVKWRKNMHMGVTGVIFHERVSKLMQS